MRPVPGIVSTVVAVEHVIACFFQYLYCLLGLLEVTAGLDIVGLLGQNALVEAACLTLYAVTYGNGEVLSALLLYFLYDIAGETESVFKGSAVFVCSVIRVFQGKLVKEVTLVYGMDFNTVNALFLEHLGGAAYGVDQLVDALLGKLLRLELLRCPEGRCALVWSDVPPVEVKDGLR